MTGPDPASVAALVSAGAAQLDAIELVRVRVPLRLVLRAAHGTTEPERDVVLVRALGRDGTEGWGECSALEAPTYTTEYTESAWAVLRDRLVPTALAGGLARLADHPMASTAIEVACADLALRVAGHSLAEAVGVAPDGDGLSWTMVVGMQASVEELLAVVEAGLRTMPPPTAPSIAAPISPSTAPDPGDPAVKFKIRPGWDLEPVGAVRARWPSLVLATDANGAYGLEDRVRLAEVVELLGPGGYIEQPLAAGALADLAELSAELPPGTVTLDESVNGVDDLDRAVAAGVRFRLNLKPARMGGLGPGLAVAARGRDRGRPTPAVPVFVGGLYETGVGRAAALALAASSVVGATATDLGPGSHYFYEDITEPIELDAQGRMRPPPGPGLGVTPRPERLAEVAVDRMLQRR